MVAYVLEEESFSERPRHSSRELFAHSRVKRGKLRAKLAGRESPFPPLRSSANGTEVASITRIGKLIVNVNSRRR